jgi:hypothetical protein
MRPPAACTASASRWSTRCPSDGRSRWRAASSWIASVFEARPRRGQAGESRRGPTGAAPRPLQARRRDLSATRDFKPRGCSSMARSKAYLFAASKSAGNARSRAAQGRRPRPRRCSSFPAALPTICRGRRAARLRRQAFFTGKERRAGGRLEWAVTWPVARWLLQPYCNTIPTPDGGTHEAGLRNALTKGLRALASWRQQEARRPSRPTT